MLHPWYDRSPMAGRNRPLALYTIFIRAAGSRRAPVRYPPCMRRSRFSLEAMQLTLGHSNYDNFRLTPNLHCRSVDLRVGRRLRRGMGVSTVPKLSIAAKLYTIFALLA